MQRDVMNYDVVIIGAGPAGLASAIHLKQLCQQTNTELSIAVLDKGSHVGAHIISGCVMNPRGLDELIPNWQELNFPVTTKVNQENLVFLGKSMAIKLPIPHDWKNTGNYIISLSQLCRRLGEYAEELGVEIYPGFAAIEPIIEMNKVVGIITGDMGVDKNGEHGANYQAGIEIRAKQVILAEGCRGSVSKQIIAKFDLARDAKPQTYGLGIKEIWRVNPTLHSAGYVMHSIGYPLNYKNYGGGFVYHFDKDLVSIGLVTALDYTNPYFSPYDEFQKFKQHPQIKRLLKNAERLEYGARAVVEGGLQSLPKLTFSGGILVGDCAGFLNVPKIKGVHNSIKSGILGAIGVFNAITKNQDEAIEYATEFKKSWLYQDLYKVRNVRPSFRYGLYFGLIYSALDYYLFKGNAPWTFGINKSDNETLDVIHKHKIIEYDKYDGKISFDKASSLHLANIFHDDGQKCHLLLADNETPITVNLAKYAAPETRYCPAGVYEIITNAQGKKHLQINAQNCIHCKACDIKDPKQNITWTPPEAGSGPQYSDM